MENRVFAKQNVSQLFLKIRHILDTCDGFLNFNKKFTKFGKVKFDTLSISVNEVYETNTCVKNAQNEVIIVSQKLDYIYFVYFILAPPCVDRTLYFEHGKKILKF